MAAAHPEDECPMNDLRINANLQRDDEFLNFYVITEGGRVYPAQKDKVAIR